MDMDQAAVWLAGSILFALGAVVIVAGIVAINNIVHRWWKPLGWNFGVLGGTPSRFATPEELDHVPPKLEPELDKPKNESKAKTN